MDTHVVLGVMNKPIFIRGSVLHIIEIYHSSIPDPHIWKTRQKVKKVITMRLWVMHESVFHSHMHIRQHVGRHHFMYIIHTIYVSYCSHTVFYKYIFFDHGNSSQHKSIILWCQYV